VHNIIKNNREMVFNCFFFINYHYFCILNTTDARRRKASLDKKQDEAVSTKHHAQISLSSSFSSEIPDEIKTVEKSSQPSVSLQNDKKEDDQQPIKKKRGRKSKAELQGNKVRFSIII